MKKSLQTVPRTAETLLLVGKSDGEADAISVVRKMRWWEEGELRLDAGCRMPRVLGEPTCLRMRPRSPVSLPSVRRGRLNPARAMQSHNQR